MSQDETPQIWEGEGAAKECNSGLAFLGGLGLALGLGFAFVKNMERRQAETKAFDDEADDRGWLMMHGFEAPLHMSAKNIGALRQQREREHKLNLEFLQQSIEKHPMVAVHKIPPTRPETKPNVERRQQFSPAQQAGFELTRISRVNAVDPASLEAFYERKRKS